MAIVEDLIGIVDLDELRFTLLRTLKRVVRSDWASLNDIGPDPGDVAALMIPDGPMELFTRYVEHRDENPIAAYIERTGDGRASRFSDHATREQLEALPLFRLVYGPMGVHHQIAFTIALGPDRQLAVALSRAAPDYTDDERDLLNRVRPLLISAFRGAVEHTELRRALAEQGDHAEFVAALCGQGLTRREAEVVRLVALGRSNQHVADELGVSDRTVGKHLEHAFRKLGVRTRSQAATRAWALTRSAHTDGPRPNLRTTPT